MSTFSLRRYPRVFVTPVLFGLLGVLVCGMGVAESAEEEAVKITPDIVYGHKDGLALTMDLFQPAGEGKRGAILFMVSGGWFSRWSPPETMKNAFRPYLEAGFPVFAVRHGSSPRYTIPEAVSDVRRAVRFVRRNAERFAIDGNRLGVLGMSAGGHLALMLGTGGDDGAAGEGDDPLMGISSRVAAVAALVPPTDLRVAVWEAPESLPAYRNFPALNLSLEEAGPHSPLTHVSPDDAPALVIMGEKDELVPPRHGEWIAEAFEREDVAHRLLILPGAGHGLEGEENQATVRGAVVEWFRRYLE